jgi:predicted O-methyltransferase YrrM
VISLDEVVARPPIVHGGTTTWGISASLAWFLDAQLTPKAVTLETGAGLSTIVILRRGVARHISVTPYAAEFGAIREYCPSVGIDLKPLVAVVAGSAEYLPSASLPALDLVLIDGAHAFPTPFLDWYYTVEALKVGGLVVVDDLQLATGRILADFMRADEKWQEVYRDQRWAAYRKLVHPIRDERDWLGQAYLARSSPVAAVRIVRAGPIRRAASLARRALADPKLAVQEIRRRWLQRSRA